MRCFLFLHVSSHNRVLFASSTICTVQLLRLAYARPASQTSQLIMYSGPPHRLSWNGYCPCVNWPPSAELASPSHPYVAQHVRIAWQQVGPAQRTSTSTSDRTHTPLDSHTMRNTTTVSRKWQDCWAAWHRTLADQPQRWRASVVMRVRVRVWVRVVAVLSQGGPAEPQIGAV
jgi:hypothetical protein